MACSMAFVLRCYLCLFLSSFLSCCTRNVGTLLGVPGTKFTKNELLCVHEQSFPNLFFLHFIFSASNSSGYLGTLIILRIFSFSFSRGSQNNRKYNHQLPFVCLLHAVLILRQQAPLAKHLFPASSARYPPETKVIHAWRFEFPSAEHLLL